MLRYEKSPTEDDRARALAASKAVSTGLAWVERHGTASDRKLAKELLRGMRVYLSAAQQMFSASGEGQDVRAQAIESEFEAVYPWLESSILKAAERAHSRSSAALRSLSVTENFVLVATPAVFAAGLLTLAFFASVLVRTRRRFEQARGTRCPSM